MAQVVELLKNYGIAIIIAIVTIFNLIMSIVNSAKQGKCIKYSDLIFDSGADELIDLFKNLDTKTKFEFVNKLKEVFDEIS